MNLLVTAMIVIYDNVTSTSGSGSYIVAAFYEQYYQSAYRYLDKNIYGNIDLTQDYKTYTLQVKSSLTNQTTKDITCRF